MKRSATMIITLLMAGCSSSEPKTQVKDAPHFSVPYVLTYCPKAALHPLPPRKPRTVDSIGDYAVRLNKALVEDEYARMICADRLEQLNDRVQGTLLIQ